MPTQTGSGTLVLPGIELSGSGEILTPDPGPLGTRQSSINISINFKGDYFDEIDGLKNDVFRWSASGFKYFDRTGDGTANPGESNRFWSRKGIRIGYGQHVDLDLYAFLSYDCGKGLGQDQLGLHIMVQEITMVLIRNKKGGSGLVIGGAATMPWTSLLTGTATLPPGFRFFVQTRNMDAWSVNSSSSRYLRLASVGNPCLVDAYFAGRFVSGS